MSLMNYVVKHFDELWFLVFLPSSGLGVDFQLKYFLNIHDDSLVVREKNISSAAGL